MATALVKFPESQSIVLWVWQNQNWSYEFWKKMQFRLWNQNRHRQNHITSKREAQGGRDIKDGMAAAAASQLARSLGQIRKLLYENGVVLGRSAPVTQYTLDERICSAGNGERERRRKKVGGDERGEQHNT